MDGCVAVAVAETVTVAVSVAETVAVAVAEINPSTINSSKMRDPFGIPLGVDLGSTHEKSSFSSRNNQKQEISP